MIVILLILLLSAVITDLSETRIPNLLILFGLISGIFYRVLCLGDRNYLSLILEILFPVLIFFPLFLIRAMGAGDIKLFAVTGAFFTFRENIKCIVLAILLGGVIAFIKILIHKNIRERWKYMLSYFANVIKWAIAGQFYGMPYAEPGKTEDVKKAGIKFSLPILLGAIMVMGGRV